MIAYSTNQKHSNKHLTNGGSKLRGGDRSDIPIYGSDLIEQAFHLVKEIFAAFKIFQSQLLADFMKNFKKDSKRQNEISQSIENYSKESYATH